MKIAVAPNPVKKLAPARAQEAIAVLQDSGCEAVMVDGLYEEGPARQAALKIMAGCDALVAVGGDGTVICAAKLAAGLDIPLLGINAGKLGFTTGIEADELALLAQLAEGGWQEEHRTMLGVTLEGQSGSQCFLALNDAVVSAELAKIIEYKMAIGHNTGYVYRADGFLVATPTGSTAYSLSGGGPVVEPTLNCMIYTPICPHSLSDRSVVFAPDTLLTVEIPRNRSRVYLTVDGAIPVELKAGDRLTFGGTKSFARFIKLTNRYFYDILNKKLLETS